MSAIGTILKPILGRVIADKLAEKSANLRTSTKTVAGAGVASQIYLQLIALVPNDAFVAAFSTPQMIALVTTLIAWGIARISKTPEKLGIL